MKTKLFIGSVVCLFSLIVGSPAYSATGTASVTVVDSSCTAFNTTVVGTDITFTCSDGPVVTPTTPTNPPVCAEITTDTPNDSGVILLGGSVKLAASCPGADSYEWAISDVVQSNTGSTLDAMPSGYTIYSVVASNSAGQSTKMFRLVAVLAPTTVPVCAPTATPSTINSGQSTQLQAGCDSATGYSWVSSTGETIDQIKSPMVSPTTDTTYTLTASNSIGISEPYSVAVSISVPVVTKTYSCGAGIEVLTASVQSTYENGGAFTKRMINDQAYTLTFTTGPESTQLQTIDIVEWSGAPQLKFVTVSKEPCNYETFIPRTRVLGLRPNIIFTVGTDVFPPGSTEPYARLEPKSEYHINIRNTDPLNGFAETCNTGCGFSLNFFSPVPF